MKKSFSIILLFLLVSAFPFKGPGQQLNIHVPLDGTENFKQILDKTDQYLKTLPDDYDKERFEKHFARWAYYESLHLGPSGEFVNVARKTLDAASRQSDAPLTSANGSWSFIGPASAFNNNPSADLLGNGRVDRMAFHPTDPNTIYVGTPAGGLWRTINGGSSWTPISNYIPSLGISGIVVDHADPNILYVLTGDGDTYLSSFVKSSGYHRLSVGVLKSTDGGTTWVQTGQLSANEFCGFRLVQHPSNANILIAATSDGIYRTTNAGNTWTQVATGRFYDIEFKPGTPATVYASGKGTFIYSTTTGASWNTTATFDNPLCAGGRVEIAVTPNSSSKVYLLAGPSTNFETGFCGLFVSTNSGVSFTRMTDTPNILGYESGTSGDQSEYDMGVAVKPTDNQRVMTCGLVVFNSTNGGSTFSDVTTYRESGGNYIHPDCHTIEYNPLNNYLYAGTDGGFYRSTNDGATWTNLFAGINTAQFYHFDDYDADANLLLGGCQDNGTKYRPSATTIFSHIRCCDGGDDVIDYTDGTQGYAVTNTSIYNYTNFTTTSPSPVASINQYFPQIEMHSSNPDILYYSYSRVVRYVNSTGVKTTLGTSDILGGWVVRTCPSNSNRIYTAGGGSAFAATGEMFVTSDGGTTWSTISNNTGFPSTFPRISDIGVRPTNSPQVYACFSGYTDGLKVLYSVDAGVTWNNISYDLPNIPIWSIEVDAANNVYVGGDMGVYYHADGSTNWEPFYNGIPNVPVSDLAINEGSDQLLASTFGRGMWKSALRAACPINLSISANLSGPRFYSASNSITMTGVITGGEGTSAVLRSGNYVRLTTGFQASSSPGNTFLASLGPCGSGMPPILSAQQQQGPVYPDELNAYTMSMTRHDGTLEVTTGNNGGKQVVLRLFAEGTARIILATPSGQFIKDVANFTGQKGTSTFGVGAEVAPGSYFLYLVVNGKVMHIQELSI